MPHPWFIIENVWEKVAILTSKPTGQPDVASVGGNTGFYDSVLDDIELALSELGMEYAPRMAEWREWIDKRPKTQADLASSASLPSWGDWFELIC